MNILSIVSQVRAQSEFLQLMNPGRATNQESDKEVIKSYIRQTLSSSKELFSSLRLQGFDAVVRDVCAELNICQLLDPTPVRPAAVSQQAIDSVAPVSSVTVQSNVPEIRISFIDGNMAPISSVNIALNPNPETLASDILNSIPEDIKIRVARIWIQDPSTGRLAGTYMYNRVNHTLARV